MRDGDGELQICRRRDADANESVVEQEAVRTGAGGDVGGAVGAVEGGEERIVTASLCEDETGAGGAEAEGLVGLMTGGAGAAVGAEALEEGILLVDVAGGVVGGDGSGVVTEGREVRDEPEDSGGGAERYESEKDRQDAAMV